MVFYAIYNPYNMGCMPCICDDGDVYDTFKEAKKHRDEIAKDFGNEDLQVVACRVVEAKK